MTRLQKSWRAAMALHKLSWSVKKTPDRWSRFWPETADLAEGREMPKCVVSVSALSASNVQKLKAYQVYHPPISPECCQDMQR